MPSEIKGLEPACPVKTPGGQSQYAGMSIRTAIAAQIMAGLVADGGTWNTWEHSEIMAERSVKLADALINELSKDGGHL